MDLVRGRPDTGRPRSRTKIRCHFHLEGDASTADNDSPAGPRQLGPALFSIATKDADGLGLEEKQVVGVAVTSGKVELADRHPAGRRQVHGDVVLDRPAGLGQGCVDPAAGSLLGGGHQVGRRTAGTFHPPDRRGRAEIVPDVCACAEVRKAAPESFGSLTTAGALAYSAAAPREPLHRQPGRPVGSRPAPPEPALSAAPSAIARQLVDARLGFHLTFEGDRTIAFGVPTEPFPTLSYVMGRIGQDFDLSFWRVESALRL